MRFITFFAVFLTLTIKAATFNAGEGAKYSLVMQEGGKADLSIYISESSFSRLGVEYYTSVDAGFAGKIDLWQQFIFGIEPDSPLFVTEGYVKAKDFKKPQKLTSEYLNVNNGVQVNDFLFSKLEEIQKFKIKDEMVEVPAGRILASLYRKERNGQTVDFWISEKAKPISLIKLVSKGKKVSHNYQIELLELLRGVKKTIEAKEAEPLNEIGKQYIAKPLKGQ